MTRARAVLWSRGIVRMERRLTSILSADVVGFSRLMGANEVATLEALKAIRTDLLEIMVWDEVCALLKDTDRVEREYQRRLQAPRQANDDLDITNRQLAKIRQGIARLIDWIIDRISDIQQTIQIVIAHSPRLSVQDV